MSDDLTELRAENERLRGDIKHWKDHAEEAGLGFSRVCKDAARLASRNTVLVERAERAEQECRDRECTEQDVRARLADAENTLARAKVEALREAAAELRANVAAWRGRGVAASTPTADWLDARAAALDGMS